MKIQKTLISPWLKQGVLRACVINSKISKLLDVLSNTYGILDLTSPQNGNVELEEGDVYVEIIPSGLAFSKKAPSLVITFGGNSNIIKSINLGKGLTDPPL